MSLIIYYSNIVQAVSPLAQVCHKTGGVFVSSRKSVLSYVKNLYPDINRASFSKRLILNNRGNDLMRHADIIVTGASHQRLLGNYAAKKCMVFHGTYAVFTREAIEGNAHFDLLCVTGPRMQSMISRHPEIKLRCVNTGFLPFAEFPERCEATRQKIMKALGLDLNRQTVIYTPSRKSVGSWDFLVEKIIKQTPVRYNLIIRPHPSDIHKLKLSGYLELIKLKKMCRERGNALLDTIKNPLAQLLSVADLVVSDANSPAEESLFYDLPQLFIESSRWSRDTLYKECIDGQMHPDDIQMLMKMYSCGNGFDALGDGLAGMIEKAFESRDYYHDARERYFNWVFGSRDRLAPERVSAALSHLLEEA